MTGSIAVKRIYDAVAPGDGQRVLVDRLWPRGVSRDAAALDCWLKAIAPSTELRKWFAHDPTRWNDFAQRYRHELDANPDAVAMLRAMIAAGDVTLLYAARDERCNHAHVLADYLRALPSA